MGDRADVVVKSKTFDCPIVLYTHWGGSETMRDVHQVLARRERWDDPSYLTRMLFCGLMPKEYHYEATSFGISTKEAGDAEHHPVIVDIDRQVVQIGHEGPEIGFASFTLMDPIQTPSIWGPPPAIKDDPGKGMYGRSWVDPRADSDEEQS